MKTNVSTLLREFPKIRRAAFAGEEVVVVTSHGNLRITAEPPSGQSILGSRGGRLKFQDEALDLPTLPETEWKPSL